MGGWVGGWMNAYLVLMASRILSSTMPLLRWVGGWVRKPPLLPLPLPISFHVPELEEVEGELHDVD